MQFTLGYVLVRFVMILMYVRSYLVLPEGRSHFLQYIIGFAGGIAFWLGALLLPDEYHWVAWLAAIAFEIIFFALPWTYQQAQDWPADAHHLVERLGIFTIIVLGETFVKVLDDAQGTLLGIEQILFGMVGLVVLYTLWWLYFSDTDGKVYDITSNLKQAIWAYSHLFLAVALVVFGVSMKKLFAETIKYPGYPLTEEYRLLFTVAIAMFLLTLALINYGTDDELTPYSTITNTVVYLGTAVVVVAVGLLVTGLTATQFTAIILLIMMALVAFNIYHSLSAPEHPPHRA